DDEGALGRHEREVAHEHRLALDLTGGVIDELRRHEHRGGVGHVLVFALFDRVLGRLEPVVAERQGHGPREVLDGTDLLEYLFEARLGRDVLATGLSSRLDPGLPLLVAQQPVERLGLQSETIRNFERLVSSRERNTTGTGAYGRGVARRCQRRGPSAEHVWQRTACRPNAPDESGVSRVTRGSIISRPCNACSSVLYASTSLLLSECHSA